MSDFKSKLPDLKELSSMTAKLFNGIKSSVSEIIKDYKEKRAQDETPAAESTEAKTEAGTEVKESKKAEKDETPKE